MCIKILEKDTVVLRAEQLLLKVSPETIFSALFAEEKSAIWLDSGLITQGARFSFIGCPGGPLGYEVSYDVTTTTLQIISPGGTRTQQQSLFAFLEQEIKRYAVSEPTLPFSFTGGFVGYLGYELKAETCQVSNRHSSPLPDAQLYFLDRWIAYDHLTHTFYVCSLSAPGQHSITQDWLEGMIKRLQALSPLTPSTAPATALSSPAWHLMRDKADYLQEIERCHEFLREGDSYEICLTNKIHLRSSLNPFHYYQQLRRINPTPYAAFLSFGNVKIACASMERFLRVEDTGQVETKPIKGTLRRGHTAQEDAELKKQLQQDEKYRAENLMIVDLLRNDLGKVCDIGSVHVPALMQVESYQSVHQLVSTVCGSLRPDVSAVSCLQSLFPGGSMTGAPKIRTMKIIDALEPEARGIYSGAIGYFSLNGAADFNIVIRTAVFDDEQVSIGVGGAIIDLSEPHLEYDEMLLKGELMLRAFDATS